MKEILVERVYDKEKNQGYRILVDRLWPRGVKKEDVNYDEWPKDITPTNQLRKDYHDEKLDYEEFKNHYEKELESNKELVEIAEKAKDKDLVLLTAVKDIKHSHIPVLVDKFKSLK